MDQLYNPDLPNRFMVGFVNIDFSKVDFEGKNDLISQKNSIDIKLRLLFYAIYMIK